MISCNIKRIIKKETKKQRKIKVVVTVQEEINKIGDIYIKYFKSVDPGLYFKLCD